MRIQEIIDRLSKTEEYSADDLRAEGFRCVSGGPLQDIKVVLVSTNTRDEIIQYLKQVQ